MDRQMDTNNDRERNKHTKEYKDDAMATGPTGTLATAVSQTFTYECLQTDEGKSYLKVPDYVK